MSLDYKGLFEKLKKEGALGALIFLFIFATFMYEPFFSFRNLTNVMRQVSMLGLVSIGMTLVILTGGIDLSVGSVFAVAGMLAAKFSYMGTTMAIVIPLIIGLFMGGLNGLAITKLKIEPFVATLAMLMGGRGLAYIIGKEDTIRVDYSSAVNFVKLGRGEFLGIGLPVWIFIATVLIATFILVKTRLGRTIYAIGSNEKGAEMMGLKVKNVKLVVYMASGFLAALAGIILTSRLGAGQPVAGDAYEMKAILSVVIGGTLITGGVGKIRGSLVGVLILGLIENIFNMQGNVDAWWRNVFLGLILLGVVVAHSEKFKEKFKIRILTK
ncbi:ABC transporter permease [uncultured Ilyobacter sp.]|uniref:ABC transporter permease n=1 Tax=uncultured Ilyobacter sp. TaxID=544433 RepID=UPI0029C61C2E|nr:ABC transporter permease [uncultured Ilyobacter sp.]